MPQARAQGQDRHINPILSLGAGDSPVATAHEAEEIIERVVEWAGSREAADHWYRQQAIPSLGDLTPEALVQTGRGALLRRYLERIAEGGFA